MDLNISYLFNLWSVGKLRQLKRNSWPLQPRTQWQYRRELILEAVYLPGRASRWLIPPTKLKSLLFGKYIILFNMTVSSAMSGLGDIIEQKLLTKNKIWDSPRTKNMAVSGLVGGILTHHWYIALEKLLPGQEISRVFRKVIIDQCVFTPIYITSFFVTMGCLEGTSIEQMKRDICTKGMIICLAESILMAPAQMINFHYVVLKYRLLFDYSVSLLFSTFYSFVKYDFQV